MIPELQRALKRQTQWFGPYKASGEPKKIQVWLVADGGQIEFLTPARRDAMGTSYPTSSAPRSAPLSRCSFYATHPYVRAESEYALVRISARAISSGRPYRDNNRNGNLRREYSGQSLADQTARNPGNSSSRLIGVSQIATTDN